MYAVYAVYALYAPVLTCKCSSGGDRFVKVEHYTEVVFSAIEDTRFVRYRDCSTIAREARETRELVRTSFANCALHDADATRECILRSVYGDTYCFITVIPSGYLGPK